MKPRSFLQLPLADLMTSDVEQIQFLQQNCPSLYETLKGIDKQTLYSIPYNDKTRFTSYFTETRLCLTHQKFYYFCYDCSLSPNVGLCKKCFQSGSHHNHKWVLKQFQGKPYCDCGFSHRFDPHSVCPSHTKTGKAQKTLTLQDQSLYLSFVTIYTKIILQKLSLPLHNNEAFLEVYANFIIDLCNYNKDYTKLTDQIFTLPFCHTQAFSVLQKFVLAIDRNCKFQNKLLRLFTILCDYEPFQYRLASALFRLGSNSDHGLQQKCSMKYYYGLCRTPQVLNRLAEQKICIFTKKWNASAEILEYYCGVVKQFSFKNKRSLLLPVWKYLKSQTKVLEFAIVALNQKQQEPYKDSYILTALQDCVEDLDFTQQMISYLVQHWRCTYLEGYNSNREFFNQLTRISLAAVQGRVQSFPLLFSTCDLNKLEKFLVDYLDQLFQDRKKCKFNSLTAKCFLPLIKKHNLPKLSSTGYSPLKISRILSVVVRNLTAFEYAESLEIMKTARVTGNNELAEQKRKKVIEWFRQYFFMRREVSAKLLIAFRKQGLMKIAEIQNFIMTQTKYSKGSVVFQYKGPQLQVNPDLLLHRLSKGDEIYGIHFEEQKDMFYQEDRSELLNTLMTNMVQRADFQNFESYTKKDRYMICMTAVLLNSITKGENKVFSQYVRKTKHLSQGMKRANPPVDRLFRIRQYGNQHQLDDQNLIKNQTTQIKQDFKQTAQEKIIKPKGEQSNIENSLIKQQEEPTIAIGKEKCQKASHSAMLNESKRKKKSMFAKKLAVGCKKFLVDNLAQEPEQHQQCLVCKEAKSDYGLLYYYASVRRKKSIMYKLYKKGSNKQGQFNLSSCFHSVHEHCCPNKNSRKCMLCTSSFDFFMPVINNQMDEADKQVMLRLWWDQEFKKQMSKIYKKMDDLQLFMVLFNSLVSTIDSTFLVPLKSASISISKNQLYLQFTRFMFRIQEKHVQKLITKAISKYTEDRRNEDIFISKVDAICSAAILCKLQGNSEQEEKLNKFVLDQLEEAKKKKEFRHFGEAFKNIEWLMGRGYPQFQAYFNKNTSLEEWWKELNFLSQIPQNMEELRKLYQSCSKNCPALSCYLCISCDQVRCGNCVKIVNHIDQQGCICINLDDGCIYYEMGGNKEKLKCPLYSNFLKEPYNPLDTDTDANEYILEKELLNEIIYKTVM